METEFWAAIAGAGVGGVISLALQWMTFNAARREREEVRRNEDATLALSLFYSLQKATNDLLNLLDWVKQADDRLKQLGGSGGRWRGLTPIVNLPKDITVSAAELSVIFRKNETELFNSIRDVEAVHNSALTSWRTYAEKRQALAGIVPANMTGMIGSTALTPEEKQRLGPVLAGVESLADAICERAEADANLADDTLARYLPFMTTLTGAKVQIAKGRGSDKI